MSKKLEFVKFIKKWGAVFIIGGVVILKSYDIFVIYLDYKNQAETIKREYIAEQKKLLRNEVGRVAELMDLQERRLLDYTKDKIKTKVCEADLFLSQLYKNFSREHKPVSEIKKTLLKTLKKLNEKINDGYYFITDFKGTMLLNGAFPEKEGYNVYSNKTDTLSRKIHKRLKEIASKQGEGFIEYMWYRRGEKHYHPKLAFVKLFKPFGWIIGTGVFLDDMEKEFQKSIFKFVNKYRFGDNKSNYIFILKLLNINGGKDFAIMYANPNRPDLVGKYLSDDYKDAKGKEFRKEFLKGLREKGECFVRYWYKKPGTDKPAPKVSYFKLAADKKFIVAAGVYLDEVENKIAALHDELKGKILEEAIASLIFTIIVVLVFLFLLNVLLRQIKNDLDVFATFLNSVNENNTPLDVSLIKFKEFVPLAKTANQMLAKKMKAEEELRNDKEKLYITMQSIGDGLISTDKEGNIVFLNKTAEALTGYSTEEAQGKRLEEVFNIVDETNGEPLENPVKKVISTGETVELSNHTILVSKNGKRYNIADSAAPIKDKNGQILGVVLVFRDVTEKYAALDALRKSEEMNAAIIDALPDIIFVFNKNFEIVAYFAQKGEDLYKSPEEFNGKSIGDILPPEIAEAVQNAVREVLANKNKISYEYLLEINGKTRHFEARFTWKSEEEVLAVVREITEKKEVEEELRKSEEKYRKLSLIKKAILESPQGIIIFALDKEYRYMDFTLQHKLMMKAFWDVEIEVGKNMLDYIRDENEKKSLKENFDKALVGESFVIVKEYKNEKNSSVFYENRYSPVFNEKNEVIGVSVYVIDITERIRAQKLAEAMLLEVEEKADELRAINKELRTAKEKAEASEKLKSEFLSQISHEVRTPLNVIISNTSLIEDELDEIGYTNETVEVGLSAIASAGKRIIRTIELILNVAELRKGDYHPTKEEFPVLPLLEHVYHEFVSSAKFKNIDLILETDLSPDEKIFTDFFALNHILVQLTDNAIKYTEKGYVKIKAEKDNETTRIYIIDTGIGISEKYLPHLFEPFTQEEQGYTRKFDGNGLGMPLIKGYADIIGVEIKVETEKGKGTVFTVIIGNPK